MNKEESKLLFQKRTELFMKYCDINGFPKPEDKIKFCDIETDIDDKTKIYTWFYRQNLDKLKNKIELYKDIYPNAYEQLKNRLHKKDKKSCYESRLACFMEYVEEHGWVSERSEIRFCDIGGESQDTARIGIWYARQYDLNGDFVRNFAEQKSPIYPKASQEILYRFKKDILPFEERLKLLMQYIEKFEIITLNEEITFADLGEIIPPSYNPKKNKDTVNVKNWFRYHNRNNQDELKQTCVSFAKQYPKAYSWIISKHEELQNYRDKKVLSFEERTVLYLAYLNQKPNEVVVSGDKLKFSDLTNIDLNSNEFDYSNLKGPISDDTQITTWLKSALSDNSKELANLLLKYQKIYPSGVQKMQVRKDQYKSLLSFEDKMQLFMKKVEANGIIFQKSPIRFCDLDPSCKDESVVGTWFANEICRSLEKFIYTLTKYKSIYPKGYEVIKNYINCSNPRLIKERAKLISTLKFIRNQMQNPVSTEKPKVKSLKKGS